MDGNVYKTIRIGTQTWMAENLQVTRFRNGDMIAEVADNKEWETLLAGGWCYYSNDSANGEIHGNLYNWFAVNDARGLCPNGWHMPSDKEWQFLIDFLGGNKIAGGKIKDTNLWNKPNEGATNSSGFTALPAGVRFFKGNFIYLGRYSGFWSSTEGNREFAWLRYLDSGNSKATRLFFGKKNGFSCRCVKD